MNTETLREPSVDAGDAMAAADVLARYAAIDPTLTVAELVSMMTPADAAVVQAHYGSTNPMQRFIRRERVQR